MSDIPWQAKLQIEQVNFSQVFLHILYKQIEKMHHLKFRASRKMDIFSADEVAIDSMMNACRFHKIS